MPQVRLIGAEGNQLGVVSIQKALETAGQSELDLVEVAPKANPPVCRITDFSKFKYDQEKKEREMKKHQARAKLKEIRLRPNIEEHDYQIKLKHAKEFLSKKEKVKISLLFRGRQMAHKDIGKKLMERFVADLGEAGKVEKFPSLEGRMISAIMGAK